MHVTVASRLLVLDMTTWLTGHVMDGTVVSAKLIWNERDDHTRPVVSAALHVTIAMPMGATEPVAGMHRHAWPVPPHVPYPDAESFTVAHSEWTLGAVCMLPAHVMTGGMLLCTVIMNVHAGDTWPAQSVTVHDTVVLPDVN